MIKSDAQARVGCRSGGMDLVHNHAESLMLGCADSIRVPIVTTVPIDSSQAVVALYAQAGKRTAFVAPSAITPLWPRLPSTRFASVVLPAVARLAG